MLVMNQSGIRVLLAATGIHLALGVLHAWQAVSGSLPADVADLGQVWPLTGIASAVAMIGAGRLQDEIGPRTVAFLGALLVGLGFVLVAFARSYAALLVGWGLLVGLGAGTAWATTIPTVYRWFPRQRSGLIAGIVLSGYGLAALWMGPVTTALIRWRGAADALLMLGGAYLVVVASLSQLLVVPRQKPVLYAATSTDPTSLRTLARSPEIRLLWTVYVLGAGAGLLVRQYLDALVHDVLRGSVFGAVAIMAIGGAAGHVVIGYLGDRCGRSRMLARTLAAQALLTIAAVLAAPGAVFLLVVTLIAFNHGGSLALLPALTRERLGLRHFGRNFGLMYSAWGLGGYATSALAAVLPDHRLACLLAGGLFVVGWFLILRRRALPPSDTPSLAA